MNNKGQLGTMGFALVMVFFIIAVVLFSTIEPFKENLNVVRDNKSLNCPGTLGHDVTDYNNDTAFERLVRRPTCFVTGFSMVYFISSVLIASAVWVIRNWSKKR